MKKISLLLILCLLICLCSCGSKTDEEETTTEGVTYDSIYVEDVNGDYVPAFDGVEQSKFDPKLFVKDEKDRMIYSDSSVKTASGIDVSEFQGEIDWEKVRADGIDFVILRAGCRGYGPSGLIYGDDKFLENYEAARAAGLEVGAYFFSQAISPEEAVEEAQFVIDLVEGLELTYPIAYDWEHVEDETARTADMTGDEITACGKAFCETVEQAGYTPQIYFNCEHGYFGYDLPEVNRFDFWLAEFNDLPTFFYNYTIWQYSETGTVDGIDSTVDMNIAVFPYMQG